MSAAIYRSPTQNLDYRGRISDKNRTLAAYGTFTRAQKNRRPSRQLASNWKVMARFT